MPVTPDSVFRDYATDGVPGSGPHKPVKSEIRELLNTIITGAAGTYRVGDGATGVLSVGDPAFAPETLTYRPAGSGGEVRFAISSTSAQLHYDNIVLGVGDGTVHAPGITWKLPDHNNVNGGADHPLLSIYAVENSSGYPHYAQFTAGQAGTIDLGMAFFANDTAHASSLKLIIPPGDNAAIGVGVGGPSSSKAGGFLHLHGVGASSVAWLRCTNGTTGTVGTDGVDIGLDSDGAAVIWHHEAAAIKFATDNVERARLTNTGFGVGATPSERMHLRSSAAGSVVTRLRIDALNSASTKTSTLQLVAQDNNAGTIRGLLNAPGPLNGAIPDQGVFEIVVEDGSKRMMMVDSLESSLAARLFLYNRSGNARITLTGADTPIINLASATGEYRVNNLKVVGPRMTGWTVDTGTAKRTANATYSGTASAGYVQAEMTAVMNALRDVTQTVKALKDDLHSTAGHGLLAA